MELSISGYRAAEIQVDFTEEHKIFGSEAQRALLRRCLTPRVIQKSEPHGRSLHAPKLEDRFEEKPCNKNDAQRCMVNGEKMSMSSTQQKTRPRAPSSTKPEER